MADYSWITNNVYSLATSGIFWAIVLVGGASLGVLALYMMKKRKFKIPTFIVVELGNGKVGFTETISGYFSKNRKFGILWEGKGEEELITKKYQVIYGVQPEDYHEFGYRRSIFVTQSADDPMILIPIHKMRINEKTREMMMDMPSLEIREAAIDAFQKTTREMKDWRDSVVQIVALAIIAVVIFLAIIFITQYAKHNVDAATDVMKSVSGDLRGGMQNMSDAINIMSGKINSRPAP